MARCLDRSQASLDAQEKVRFSSRAVILGRDSPIDASLRRPAIALVWSGFGHPYLDETEAGKAKQHNEDEKTIR